MCNCKCCCKCDKACDIKRHFEPVAGLRSVSVDSEDQVTIVMNTDKHFYLGSISDLEKDYGFYVYNIESYEHGTVAIILRRC